MEITTQPLWSANENQLNSDWAITQTEPYRKPTCAIRDPRETKWKTVLQPLKVKFLGDPPHHAW